MTLSGPSSRPVRGFLPTRCHHHTHIKIPKFGMDPWYLANHQLRWSSGRIWNRGLPSHCRERGTVIHSKRSKQKFLTTRSGPQTDTPSLVRSLSACCCFSHSVASYIIGCIRSTNHPLLMGIYIDGVVVVS